MSNKPKGINYKLLKVMGIQLVLISLVTLLSVYGAAKVVEDVLIKEALEGEAEFFWKHYESNPNIELPKTLNLTGYFKNSEKLPAQLKALDDGYHRVEYPDDRPLVHVSTQGDKQLILVFKEGQVSRLAFYFGIAPLAFVLLIIYLPAWITFMMSKRAISPVVKLAKRVDNIEVSAASDITADFTDIAANANAEVMSLIKAFEHYSVEVSEYVRRENNFTRYASHELRTPLAVMKGSIAILDKQGLESNSQRILDRMSKVTNDMERLIDALLLLARNQKLPQEVEGVDLTELINSEIENLKLSHKNRSLSIDLTCESTVIAKVPQYLFSICFSNILSNAVNYDLEGSVKVDLTNEHFSVEDFGQGMSQSDLDKIHEPFYRSDTVRDTSQGFGLGMAIVKTICERMRWDIHVESVLGKGTKVTLVFAN